MRFLISVDDNWSVTITCSSKNPNWRQTHSMRKLPDPGSTSFFPAPSANLADLPDDPLCRGDVAEIARVYRHIRLREPADGEIERFGRYLFYSLIGQDAWQAIKEQAQGESLVELVLSWSPDKRDLHRLNWEMMNDGNRFLVVEVPDTMVVISRVVPGPGQARELSVPPRVLFVLGTLVADPKIRPGAEFLGLLRTLKTQGISLNYRLLENATPKRMHEAIISFKPDVVHFMCHGDIDPVDGRGFLELQIDESDTDVKPDERDALMKRKVENLLPYLKDAEGLPPRIVVLSACYSASPGSPIVVQGPYLAAPLAAELVAGGVPVVLGMGGRISDFACRLFTRGFGEALLQGKSLARAAGVARVAAFAEGAWPRQVADWAFPTMFISNQVNEDYVPVKVKRDNPIQQVENWIVAYQLMDQPVFCGRDEFFQAYYELFKCDTQSGLKRPAVLMAAVEKSEPGYGKTRLLEELTAQALRDGHVPCLVRLKKPKAGVAPQGDLLKDALELGKIIMQAINNAREILHLDPRPYSQVYGLLTLPAPFNLSLESSKLDERIKAVLTLETVTIPPKAVQLAIQIELLELIKEARAKHTIIREAKGRAIVLLDDVDLYGNAIDSLNEMLSGFGLGTAEEPVPVVLACSKTGPVVHMLKPISDKPVKWLKEIQLHAFNAANDEDLLAYNWLLLNPFCKGPQLEKHTKPLVINDLATASVTDTVKEFFRERFKGLPGALAEAENFYSFTRVMLTAVLTKEFFMPADDDDFMDKWRKVNQWANQ